MPSLSHKKRGRGGHRQQVRSLKEANRILRAHKEQKYLENQGGSWKYGHMRPNQVLSGTDKWVKRKERAVKDAMVRTADMIDIDGGTNPKRDDRNLDEWRDHTVNLMRLREMNADPDALDPSEDDLDDEALKEIDDNDDIFQFRRNRSNKIASDYDEDDVESSGDDFDIDEDHIDPSQMDSNQPETMEDTMNMDNDSNSSDDNNDDEPPPLRTLHGPSMDMDLNEWENEIDTQFQNDPVLRLSDQFNQRHTSTNMADNDNEIDNDDDDDDSSILSEQMHRDKSESWDRVLPGIGNISWGSSKKDYYGADTNASRIREVSKQDENEAYRELRDEERIGIQQQRDSMQGIRENFFVDPTIMDLSDDDDDEENDNGAEQPDQIGTKQIPENSQKLKRESPETKVDTTVSQPDQSNSRSTERVRKNLRSLKKDVTAIIRRDHPELPGIIHELKLTLKGLEQVYSDKKRVLKSNHPDAIKDWSLYLDLLKMYGVTLAFYLKLKNEGIVKKKHNIFSKMLQLRHRVKQMYPVYLESLKAIENLPDSFNPAIYTHEKQRMLEEARTQIATAKEARLTEQKRREDQRARDKARAKEIDLARQEKIKEYVRKEERKMVGWDLSEGLDEEGNKNRRHIQMKIFKSTGLKRYRKGGIPRIKQKRKYERAQKLRRRMGYKAFKGKSHSGRGEKRISTQYRGSISLDGSH